MLWSLFSEDCTFWMPLASNLVHLQWKLGPCCHRGMNDQAHALIVTLWNLTVTICPFYLDTPDCCISW